ncbi:MAG: hypothetical protein ACREHC_02580 [Candidatus Levyibacteriota bacterium]
MSAETIPSQRSQTFAPICGVEQMGDSSIPPKCLKRLLFSFQTVSPDLNTQETVIQELNASPSTSDGVLLCPVRDCGSAFTAAYKEGDKVLTISNVNVLAEESSLVNKPTSIHR